MLVMEDTGCGHLELEEDLGERTTYGRSIVAVFCVTCGATLAELDRDADEP